MTDKNARGYWIKAKGREKFEDTTPERAFAEFAKGLGYQIEKGQAVWMDGWRLTPDFDMKLGRSIEIVILIDGRYHWTDTQAKKDRWRDELYAKAGKKVIHIDAGLTQERYWKYLADYFLEAITRAEPVRYIRE